MITYNNLYLELRKKLKEADLPGAALEARELLCRGSGKTREEFYRDAPLYVAPQTERAIRSLAERRLDGEPAAYLLGEWDFYGLTLDVTPAVLIPRVDTEVLAEEAIAFVKEQGRCRVLDLCAGSGCVGLAVAANAPACRVVLGELDPEALRVCRGNIRRCGLGGQVSAVRMDALRPPPGTLGEFRCIVCNPPYIPDGDVPGLDRSVRDFEPRLALCGGEDGYDFYTAIIRQWRDILSPGGRMYFEVGIGQADTVRAMMCDGGFADVAVVPDTGGIDRVVYGTLREVIGTADCYYSGN